MKKIVLLMLIPIFIYASNFNENVKINSKLTKTFLNKNVFKDFESYTNHKINFYEIKKDSELMKGIYALYFKKKTKKIDKYLATKAKTVTEKYSLPDYINGFNHLSNSKSIYSAWVGARIINQYLMAFDDSGRYTNNQLKDIVNKYYPGYLDILMKNKVCYGYYLATRYYKSYNTKKSKYLQSLKTGYKICKGENHQWLRKRMNMEYAQRVSYEKLIKNRHTNK